jgi:hypothetical protein
LAPSWLRSHAKYACVRFLISRVACPKLSLTERQVARLRART